MIKGNIIGFIKEIIVGLVKGFISLVLLIIGLIFAVIIVFVVAYHDRFEDLTINVDRCLQKENFREEGFYIIETLESECLVTNKRWDEKEPVVTLKVLDEDDYTTEVELDADDMDYNDITILDKVVLHREVYYFKNGFRLFYRDIVSKGEEDE